jgi:hypothetical protein
MTDKQIVLGFIIGVCLIILNILNEKNKQRQREIEVNSSFRRILDRLVDAGEITKENADNMYVKSLK